MQFQRERLEDIWEDLPLLVLEHWQEVALKDVVGPLHIDKTAYEHLQHAGALHITTARLPPAPGTIVARGTLVGYAVYILQKNLHYKHKLVAESDVFYLAPEWRRGLTGLRLLRAAEAHLTAQGVNIIVQKTKTAHDCGALFRRMGYTHVEQIYMKGVC